MVAPTIGRLLNTVSALMPREGKPLPYDACAVGLWGAVNIARFFIPLRFLLNDGNGIICLFRNACTASNSRRQRRQFTNAQRSIHVRSDNSLFWHISQTKSRLLFCKRLSVNMYFSTYCHKACFGDRAVTRRTLRTLLANIPAQAEWRNNRSWEQEFLPASKPSK